MHFKIADYSTATELLVNVAVTRGKLIKVNKILQYNNKQNRI